MRNIESASQLLQLLSLRGVETALQGSGYAVSAGELVWRVRARVELLQRMNTRVLATLGDNSADWVVTDLAALVAQRVHVPLPEFFSQEQSAAAMQAAGVDTVAVAPQAYVARQWGAFQVIAQTDDGWYWLQRQIAAVPFHQGTRKITFTSGSTGAPKGVCLSEPGMLQVAGSVADVMTGLGLKRHLTALPFPVLLENVAGLYSALLRGAVCVCLSQHDVGLAGASRFDPARFHEALCTHEIDSVIVLPQMLKAYVGWMEHQRLPAPVGLTYMAVGGAPVGEHWLQRAHDVGLPAYEGYGLSEGGSVQTINLPKACKPGSVGLPLSHARVRIADDGEILIAGSIHLGYLGQPERAAHWLATGDLGWVDHDGFVYLRGRKKNVLITGYGRNVSPEWVETRLQGQAAVSVAVVLGDGQPALGAVIWPTAPTVADARIQQAIDCANAGLPDYARVGPWCRAMQAYSPEHGVCTANGRPVRAAISARYSDALFPEPGHDRVCLSSPRTINPDLTEIS